MCENKSEHKRHWTHLFPYPSALSAKVRLAQHSISISFDWGEDVPTSCVKTSSWIEETPKLIPTVTVSLFHTLRPADSWLNISTQLFCFAKTLNVFHLKVNTGFSIFILRTCTCKNNSNSSKSNQALGHDSKRQIWIQIQLSQMDWSQILFEGFSYRIQKNC